MTYYQTLGDYRPHCTGCRCYAYWVQPTYTSGITFTTAYQPRHRKPGPAQ